MTGRVGSQFYGAIVHHIQLTHTHADLFYGNTSTVGCTTKLLLGSSIVGGCLLRFLGMRIHATQVPNITPISISVEHNCMADVVSPDFQKGESFAANNNLTEYFQNHPPLPQGYSWNKFTLLTKWTQQVILCMLGKQWKMGSLLSLSSIRKNNVRHCNAIPPHRTLTPSSKTVNNLTSSFLSHLFLHGFSKFNMIRDFK